MAVNYTRPAFTPAPKPSERKAVVKKNADAEKSLTRRQVIAKVWLRDKGRCVRCGKKCKGKSETYPLDPDRGEVNDIVPRSKGGNPLDVNNNELVCRGCHYGGPSGAHAPTPARMKKRSRKGTVDRQRR
jgi:5-methylcytosine-specific restriction endonuclease McrA